MEKVIETIVDVLNTSPEKVTVIIQEISDEHYAKGEKSIT